MKPSLRKSGTHSGANLWATWCTMRCASARVADNQLYRRPFAMQECAMRLQKVAGAGSTLELPSQITAGMAVGAQVTQPHPASIRTARMGAKVHRVINDTGASG